MGARIVTLPGDGIGPEILAAARELLGRLGDFEFDEHLVGGASIDAHGTALTDEVLEACRGSDAVLLAAVGGPKWDTTDPDAPRPEQGLLGLRKGLGLFANLRPVRPSAALLDASPLKRDRIEGTDLLVVRELTGGIYFGDSGRDGDSAHDDCAYSVAEVERIARWPSSPRARKVTSVDKANVLETSRLWRETVDARGRPRIRRDPAGAPAGGQRRDAARLAADRLRRDRDREHVRRHPQRRGGDAHRLARDAAERLARRRRPPGLFEPVHGSAPDIAGTGTANPLAMFGSVALMLRHGLAMESEAAALESAIDQALEEGLRTRDLGGEATTEEATRAVLGNL